MKDEHRDFIAVGESCAKPGSKYVRSAPMHEKPKVDWKAENFARTSLENEKRLYFFFFSFIPTANLGLPWSDTKLEEKNYRIQL